MRKFFSFRSSSSSNGNDSFAPSDQNRSKKKVHSGKTDVINTKTSNQEKFHIGFRTPEEYVLKPLNQNLKDVASSNAYLRRSLSFSSADVCRNLNDESFDSLSDQRRMTSCHDNDLRVSQYPLPYQSSFIPDRCARLERDNLLLNSIEMPSSPGSIGAHQQPSDFNSASNSPILQKSLTTRSSLISSQSNVVDRYIDEEHEYMKAKHDSPQCPSEAGEGGIVEYNKVPIIGRPPRALCKASSSSPHYSIHNVRSHSFREIRDRGYDHSSSKWTSDDLKPAAQQKFLENNIESMSCTFRDKSSSSIRECGTRINTPAQDICEDSSDGNAALHLAGTAQGCSYDLIPINKKFDGLLYYESFDLQKKVPFSRRGHNELVDSKVHEHDTDEGLVEKLKELEERYCLPHEENCESEKIRHCSLSSAALQHNISKVKEDRRYLATELSLQIRNRLAERSLANERLTQSKLELNTRTRRLEKEKNDLKLSLENELDKRTDEWSLKLSKLQAEEQRLRERVRELAEQNVSLQREISWFQGSELETRNSVVNIERQLNESIVSQNELKADKCNLHQALLELQVRCNRAEEQRDHHRSSFKERERENTDLQKLVGRLQKTCSEQDKTISGLRQSCSREIEKLFSEGDNDVVQLQTEKMRLAGVEQNLRRELESWRIEVESLRNENFNLLNRLQGTVNGYGFSSVRLNLELHSWVESLKMRSLSLLDDSSHLCCQLLDFNACKRYENFKDDASDAVEYSVAELTLKFQNLTRAIGSFRRSLQILSTILDERSSIQASKGTTETDSSNHQKGQRSQDDMEMELKAEVILTKLLREKVCSKELENEQLHGDLASSIRRCDFLQTDIHRLQDEVSCLNHKKMDMEIEMVKKDENALMLQQDLQECTKELTATRNLLANVSMERDYMWEEMKHLRENNMLTDCEIKSLHKKIEMLDEDILYKEGQISILKDSLTNKAFDICSPNSTKQFNVQ
ncbi:hypothetical protein KSP39_PZI018229 [Platanthera zijinensis]|uniref:DUF7653 domain-containing protein n=1 Tax=Platanthera zijinensis TaxID=2320716 RepID=A0AAP0B4M4_9ASPA